MSWFLNLKSRLQPGPAFGARYSATDAPPGAPSPDYSIVRAAEEAALRAYEKLMSGPEDEPPFHQLP